MENEKISDEVWVGVFPRVTTHGGVPSPGPRRDRSLSARWSSRAGLGRGLV